jgi:8-oxo-dGTP diphosphatase
MVNIAWRTRLKRCAGGILFKDGRVLLGKRSPDREVYPNEWDVIGGHCLPGEKPAQTLVREMQEEIGVTPTAFSELAVLREPRPELYGEREYYIFLATGWVGQGPIVLEAEHSEIRWFAVDEAMRLDLAHPAYVDLLAGIERQTAE